MYDYTRFKNFRFRRRLLHLTFLRRLFFACHRLFFFFLLLLLRFPVSCFLFLVFRFRRPVSLHFRGNLFLRLPLCRSTGPCGLRWSQRIFDSTVRLCITGTLNKKGNMKGTETLVGLTWNYRRRRFPWHTFTEQRIKFQCSWVYLIGEKIGYSSCNVWTIRCQVSVRWRTKRITNFGLKNRVMKWSARIEKPPEICLIHGPSRLLQKPFKKTFEKIKKFFKILV